MRIIIIGAVAAGTSAAAKARRNSEGAEIVIYEKDGDISYSGCGIPYFLGGHLHSIDDLTPRDPAYFKDKYNIDVFTRHEVLAIESALKRIQVKNLTTGSIFTDHYDKLVIATGASAVVAPIQGVDKPHVFILRNISDTRLIKAYLDTQAPKTAVIIGSGFIGLEMCENLQSLGIGVTVLEKLPHVTPALDDDMAVYVEDYLTERAVAVRTNITVQEITDDAVMLSDGEAVQADMVLLATGVRPNTSLAKATGIAIGASGAIRVNEQMQASLPDIYACGDCIETYDVVTGRPLYRPLGSTANKTGRIAGDQITGGDLRFRGVLGTGIFRVFDLTVAQTGLSEREARAQGYDVVVCHNIKPDKPAYMGGKEMVIKCAADAQTGRLLGVQIVGFEGVDKRIDVFVTAITFKAKAEDLFHLDLAYAPPFSTTKDPVMYTGMILENALHRGRKQLTAQELDTVLQSGEPYTLIDTRVPAQFEDNHIDTARSIPHSDLRIAAETLDKDKLTVTYCNKGVTGNAAQNILLGKGFKHVYSLSGGQKQYKKTHRK
ncbi:MAG TPA: FAD-dependent oxidoreductase [Candidatus Limiplasma sp.]|nr:FAD-dependent oxidoreductase [Candidatus Limiplasma sp.]